MKRKLGVGNRKRAIGAVLVLLGLALLLVPSTALAQEQEAVANDCNMYETQIRYHKVKIVNGEYVTFELTVDSDWVPDVRPDGTVPGIAPGATHMQFKLGEPFNIDGSRQLYAYVVFDERQVLVDEVPCPEDTTTTTVVDEDTSTTQVIEEETTTTLPADVEAVWSVVVGCGDDGFLYATVTFGEGITSVDVFSEDIDGVFDLTIPSSTFTQSGQTLVGAVGSSHSFYLSPNVEQGFFPNPGDQILEVLPCPETTPTTVIVDDTVPPSTPDPSTPNDKPVTSEEVPVEELPYTGMKEMRLVALAVALLVVGATILYITRKEEEVE